MCLGSEEGGTASGLSIKISKSNISDGKCGLVIR